MTIRKSARSVSVPVNGPEQSIKRAARRAAVQLLERRQLLASVVVNTTADDVNDSLINGTSVTLREAVNYEDANGGGTINFDPTVFATPQIINLAGRGGLSVTNTDLTIDALQGVLIEANIDSTIFAVAAGSSLSLTGFTLAASDTPSGSGSLPGGWNRVTNTPTNTGNPLVDPPAIVNQGTLSLANCTFAGNSVAAGPTSIESTAGSSLTAANCTFSNNAGPDDVDMSGSGTLNDCTFSGSSDTFATLVVREAGSLTLNNSIVDGNVLENNGAIRGANNLVTDGVTGTGTGTLASPVNGTLLIAPLADNGGQAPTMALLPGSAGIGAASVDGVATDERGDPRTSNGTQDIGAFQTQGFTITATGGSGQSATVGQPFTDLTATVTSPIGDPVVGGIVTFTGPSTGASITTVTAPITAGGGVDQVVTANGIAGSYTVAASAAGITTPAQYALANIGLVIDSTSRSLVGNTLPATIAAADALGGNQTITVDFAAPAVIDLKGSVPLQVTPGVNITIVSPYGVLVEANTDSTIFSVAAGSALSLTGFTLAASDTQSGSGSLPGGWNRVTNTPTNTGNPLVDPPAILNQGTLSLANCTFAGNSVAAGATSIDSTAGSSLTAANCTFSNNAGPDDVDLSGSGTLNDCTFSGSSDTFATLVVRESGSLTVNNSIVDGSVLENNGVMAGSNNLVTDGVTGTGTGTLASPVSGTLLIAPLADNGGQAPTMALLPGSAGIGAGVPINGITTDETGYARSATAPSVGAYENEGFTITATGGGGQTTVPLTPFATELGVQVASDNPLLTDLAGGVVTFSAPATGAGATFGTNPITLASDGTGGTAATANGTPGTYAVTATASGIANAATFGLTNAKLAAAIQLGNLAPMYNGHAQFATVATTPMAGLSYTVTYTQNNVVVASPTAAGTYAVTVTINDPTYQGTATGNLVIAQAAPSFSLTVPTGVVYTGSPIGATATVAGVNGMGGPSLEGVPLRVTYAPYTGGSQSGGAGSGQVSTTPPTAAGSYTVSASFPGSADYTNGSKVGVLTIAQATSAVTVADAGGTYTGTLVPATGTVTGAGGLSTTPTFSYAGTGSTTYSSATAPTNAGTYAVTAAYAGDANHAGSSASTQFTIAQATPTISVVDVGGVFNGSPYAATGTVTGMNGTGLGSPYYQYFLASDTSFSSPSGTAPTAAGSYVAIGFSPYNANYVQVGQAAYFSIAKAPTTVTVGDNGGTYNGLPFPATGTVTGAGGLSVTPTFAYAGTGGTTYGGATAPTNAGNYTVTTSYLGDANHTGNAATVAFTIAQATPTLTVTDAGGVYDAAPYAATGTTTGVNGTSLGSPTYRYYLASDTSFSNPTTTAPTNVGSYVLIALSPVNPNYMQVGKAVYFPITQASSVLTPVATTVAYGGSTTLSTTLKTTGGVLLAGRTVTFTVNGKSVGTAVTNASGVASVADSVAGITPGVYASGISVSFAGDANSTATSATASLTVLDAPIVSGVCVSNLLIVATVAGSFTQARTGAAAGDFVATVNWGDGTSQQLLVVADLLHPGQFDLVGLGHVYLKLNQPYTVTVTVSTVGKFGAVAGAVSTLTAKIVA